MIDISAWLNNVETEWFITSIAVCSIIVLKLLIKGVKKITAPFFRKE